MSAPPGRRPRLPTAACAAAMLACACGATAPAPAPEPARRIQAATEATPPAAASALAADAISVAPPAEFDRYPALAAAVQGVATESRERFEAEAAQAAARGEDVRGWTLRIGWRLLRGNRYLWVVEGEGEAVRGAMRTPVQLRLAYDGIGRQVLDFGDWFAPGAWPDVVAMLRGRLPPAVPEPAEAWRTLAYEPIHSPEGPVLRFDLLLPATAGRPPQRVAIARAEVEPWVAEDRRVLLDATAAGP